MLMAAAIGSQQVGSCAPREASRLCAVRMIVKRIRTDVVGSGGSDDGD